MMWRSTCLSLSALTGRATPPSGSLLRRWTRSTLLAAALGAAALGGAAVGQPAKQKEFAPEDYTLDAETAAPQACFRFTERLASGRVDFSNYVVVSGVAKPAVTAKDNQLCVEGLKHGERYAVVLRPGLPAASGSKLAAAADYEIYVRDRAPLVRFTGRNYVLPRTGQEGIPVVSVNAGEIEIEVYRIGDRNLLPTLRSEEFLAQLSDYGAKEIGREKGFKIWTGTLDARRELNREVTTAFPVHDAVGPLEPGIYVMTARPKGAPTDDDWAQRATQWFVVSDFGLTAFKGNDGVHVFLRSLASAEPLKDVEIRLVARNNEVLATKRTDELGHAAFDPGLARGQGGAAPGLVVASSGADYGFLDLGQAAFDLTDRGVKGREAPGPIEAYVFPERGVYRSGETVHVTALVRDAKGVAVAGLPLTMVVERPDGVEYRRVQVEDQGLGGRALSLPILPGAQRGTWRVAAYTDPKGSPVGEASFLVEDYVPERLELALTPRAPVLKPGEAAVIDVVARYLYGAPGAELKVSGEVVVEAAKSPAVKGLEEFSAGLEDEAFEATTVEIQEPATTDARGAATLTLPVQEAATQRPIQAKILLRVAEAGGRAVERSVTLPILPAGPVIGVRKNFGGDLASGALATFDVVLAAPDGTRLSRAGVAWTLSRVERRYQWFNQDGRWGFEPVKSERRVADGQLELTASRAGRIAVPVDWGTYRLDVKADGLGDTAQTSTTFTVGWSGEATADTPDLLDMSLDKASYAAGETIRARLAPRFAGKATLAVVSDRVHDVRVVDVPPGGATFAIPANADWGAGAYLVALAHRPLDTAAKRQPGRALGLAWFALDRDKRKLEVSLDAPARMRPRGRLTLPIRIAGLAPGEQARITVAAVDVGILNLTRYQAPDPGEHFFGQKRLATEIRDLYGYLIDGMQGTRGAIRSGGDAEPGLEGAPPTQEPLARYSGVVTVAPDGSAEVSFDIPAFNGTLRVMAAAWSTDRVGHAVQDVIVRDPVVVAGTLPRFLTVGDDSRLFLQIDNVEGAAGAYAVDLDVRGPLVAAADSLRRRADLGTGGRTSLALPLAAAGVGAAELGVRISGPGIDATQSFALRVQPGTSALVHRTVRPLEPGASMTLTRDLLAGILPGTGAVSVAVSPLAALDVPSLLQSLDRYPYGCAEQIVSRALPLLYVNNLAAREALALDSGLDDRIRAAVERVLSRQGPDGSFGLWSVGGDDLWLDAYVTDFLTRARERGFAVPQLAVTLALDRLRNFVANATDLESTGEGVAYAAYVLARSGRPVMGDLRYLADAQIGSLRSPLARAQLAAALALLGDRGRAQKAFAAAAEHLRETKDAQDYRADYGSRLRDGAGILTLAYETGAATQIVPAVTRVIEEERASRRYTSTQDNAWMVLAAQAVGREAEGIALTVSGRAHRGAFYRTYRDAALADAPVTLVNAGKAPVRVVVGVAGHPTGFEPALSRGFTVERTYYKLDGTKVEAPGGVLRVRQNERLVVALEVSAAAPRDGRLLLVDRLPAGFEIDNPKLVDGGTVAALQWLTAEVEPANAEYRDDRFVAAFDPSEKLRQPFKVAYMVRAVTPGRYVHPPAEIEDMYAPERFGRTGFGTVEVAPAAP